MGVRVRVRSRSCLWWLPDAGALGQLHKLHIKGRYPVMVLWGYT